MSDMPCSITDGPQTPEEQRRAEGELVFRNYYECSCGTEWDDEWTSMCDDRCPKCNTSISPYTSEELLY